MYPRTSRTINLWLNNVDNTDNIVNYIVDFFCVSNTRNKHTCTQFIIDPMLVKSTNLIESNRKMHVDLLFFLNDGKARIHQYLNQ